MVKYCYMPGQEEGEIPDSLREETQEYMERNESEFTRVHRSSVHGGLPRKVVNSFDRWLTEGSNWKKKAEGNKKPRS